MVLEGLKDWTLHHAADGEDGRGPGAAADMMLPRPLSSRTRDAIRQEAAHFAESGGLRALRIAEQRSRRAVGGRITCTGQPPVADSLLGIPGMAIGAGADGVPRKPVPPTLSAASRGATERSGSRLVPSSSPRANAAAPRAALAKLVIEGECDAGLDLNEDERFETDVIDASHRPLAKAAKAFNARHARYTGSARGMLTQLTLAPTESDVARGAGSTSAAFDRGLVDVRRNRLAATVTDEMISRGWSLAAVSACTLRQRTVLKRVEVKLEDGVMAPPARRGRGSRGARDRTGPETREHVRLPARILITSVFASVRGTLSEIRL